MAFRRRVGNLAGDFLRYYLDRKNESYRSGLIGTRQRELADLNNDNEIFRQVLADRTGQLAEQLSEAGDLRFSPLVPRAERVTAQVGADIAAKTKRQELPTDIDIESMVGSRPGGRTAAKDPRVIEGLANQRNARKEAFDRADEFEVDKAGATSFAQSYGQGIGSEQATAESFPAKLGRDKQEGQQKTELKLNEERQLTPIMVDRSTRTARGLQHVENTNPIIDQNAAQVMQRPELLSELTPTMRAQVLSRLNTPEFRSASQRSVQTLVESAENALDKLLKSPGKAGAVGAPSFADPASFIPFGNRLAGSDPATYLADVKQLASSLTLPRLSVLRGLGHMSDREFGSVANSISVISEGLESGRIKVNEPRFDAALQDINRMLQLTRERAGLPPRTPDDVYPSNQPEVNPALEQSIADKLNQLPSRRQP
jgi:hypothetical protein